ncbi:hypothetical protein Leryth_002818 [Lithospermum erythrorhizon]|uniref:AP2/ERF domain-containing protein n=1 Tax=Lithospermum erythrorhizon TaxID=34254 RepID=A0AAV3PKC8_LITER|nr:hypothetical protein Leryth_002818 [Lithospermum erythrorhizon]
MINHTTSSSSSSSDISRAKTNNKNGPNVVKSSHKRRGGRKIFKETRHPVYRGVRQRNGCRWVCEVREPNKKSRIWLGTFTTPEMAAKAYDVAVLALRGESAELNFPESAYQLPRAQSSSVVDIQKAAFLAATQLSPYSWDCPSVPNAFLPQESGQIIEKVVENGSSIKLSVVSQNISLVENQKTPREYLFNVDEAGHGYNNNNYNVPFLDEEEIFDMPALINNMAEGMLLTPPAMMKGYNWDDDDVDEGNIDLSLWTY